MAVANLQSYLQYVLLFQPKTPRIYWQLALLSLGQVAIASTLVPGPMFGMMLVAVSACRYCRRSCCCCCCRASGGSPRRSRLPKARRRRRSTVRRSFAGRRSAGHAASPRRLWLGIVSPDELDHADVDRRDGGAILFSAAVGHSQSRSGHARTAALASDSPKPSRWASWAKSYGIRTW